MMFKFSLFNIQHIKELQYSLDLSKNEITCIVGKNSVGKTTLIRAIANLKSSDTFSKTASPYIFKANSKIIYDIDGEKYYFQYDPKQNIIDTKSIINSDLKNSIDIELPIPYGSRFSHFQRLGEIDGALRTLIALQKYETPEELVDFLSNIYGSDRFINLKEVAIKGENYYFILKNKNYYIREDYLSSGEYFVIHLYKLIQKRKKLIVIDEIDISLDASAQVKLLEELRQFCALYKVNVLFTTQSLALMKSFSSQGKEKLQYMENNNGLISIQEKSYNYVKSILYGFKGWDKYILVEDDMLAKYLHFLLKDKSIDNLKYKIIYIAGATNVVNLMGRNTQEEFFAPSEHVYTILDGDQKNKTYCKTNKNIFFIPFESIEKELMLHYDNKEFPFSVSFPDKIKNKNKPKSLYSFIKKKKYMTDNEIFLFLNDKNKSKVKSFKTKLIGILS